MGDKKLKKFLLVLCTVFLVFTAISNIGAAEYQITQLTDNPYTESTPKINNNGHMVWDGWDQQDSEIFLYNGTNIIQLTNNTYPDGGSQINNNGHVVWYGRDQQDSEIFLYNGTNVIQFTNNTYDDREPQINDNGQMVWSRVIGSRSKLFFYNGTNTVELYEDKEHYLQPQINNNGQVVWTAFNDLNYVQIFLYDGSETIQLTNNSYTSSNPNINNNGQVTWWDQNTNVFFYDGSETIQLDNNTYNSLYPQINDLGYVTWRASSADGNNKIIFLYNGSETIQLKNNSYYSFSPQINNNGQVVWYDSFGSGDYGISLYDGIQTIQLTNNSYTPRPKISDNGSIAWMASDGNDNEIFLATPINNSGDNCPNDPYKTEPGVCGCGVPETDTNSDGEPDCIDDDDDGDGMLDTWEEQYSEYNGGPCLNPLADDADDDCDGDGVSNIDEFTQGTEPNNPDSKLNQPPTAPILSNVSPMVTIPTNNATGIKPNDTYFKWNASDDLENDPFKYCVTIKEDGTEKVAFAGCDNNIFDYYWAHLDGTVSFTLPVALKSGTKYWWAVWAKENDQDNWSEASDWWPFETETSLAGDYLTDNDDDGIPDSWEENGVDFITLPGCRRVPAECTDGTPDLNLEAMGALPDQKDIFVEIDSTYYMENGVPISAAPTPEELQPVLESFYDHGTGEKIYLHIDAGSNFLISQDNTSTWGDLSMADSVEENKSILFVEDNNNEEFYKFKNNHFTPERKGFFHYCIFSHDGTLKSGGEKKPGVSFGANLIIAVEDMPKLAGTFMHELGHTLGLHHGGPFKIAPWEQLVLKHKPNLLSVMNYSFSGGIPASWADNVVYFNYSGFKLPPLDENNLDESSGLTSGLTVPFWIENYKTKFWDIKNIVPNSDWATANANGPIDWNQTSGSYESTVSADIDNNDEL